MKSKTRSYRGHRLPLEILSHGVLLYYRNLFNLGRHKLSSANRRLLRERSFKGWSAATAA